MAANEPNATPGTPPDKVLRAQAEELLRASSADIDGMRGEDVQSLIHELQVHQIELEIQNEELREAQVELAESRDLYADLYDFAPVGYLTIGKDQRITAANLAAADLLGVERKNLVGSKMTRFVGREAQDAYYLHHQAVFSNETKQVCQLGMCRPDGVPLAVRLESVAVGDPELHRCRTALIDVTERERGEQEMHELNETLEQRVAEQTSEVRLLAEAISNLGEGVLITTGNLEWPGPEIVFVNDAMCKISGFRSEELIGQSPRILQGAKTNRETLDHLRRQLSAGRSCTVELTNYRKDGMPYAAESFIAPLLEESGRRSNFVSIHRDITNQREAEDAQKILGRIIEESLNEIFIFDADTLQYLQVNRGGRDNLGYSNEELLEMTPLKLKTAMTRERFDSLLEPLRSGKKREVVFETRHQRKDGSRYDVEAHLQMATFRGRPCFVAINLDTTERRELEQEVVNAAEEERQRIAHDLHDDLGSLLTGVKLRIEALNASLADPQGDEAANGASIAGLVRDAIAKTRNIARGLRPVDTDPEDLMGALRILSERVESTTDLSCDLHCAKPVLLDDPLVSNHLFRIAQEAVNNAVKYSGGTRIAISLAEVDGEIILTIADDGAGFDRHKNREGGLGLHIMSYRANAINGSLRVEPRKKGGMKVVCTLPGATERS